MNTNFGQCGEHLTWEYDEEQRYLTIRGSGPMQFDRMPWAQWKDEIECVTLDECSFVCADAFRDCTNLRHVSAENLQEIGASAFEGCCHLDMIDFGRVDKVRKVAERAFRNCSALSFLHAEEVQIVGARAFENCTVLDLGECCVGTEEIGAYAFANCESLSGLPMYDWHQGWMCHAVIEQKAGSKLSVIPEGAFLGCKGLTKINIPNTVREIKSRAFAQCANLAEIMLCAETTFDLADFVVEPQIVDGFGSCGVYSDGRETRWIQKDGMLRFTGNGIVTPDITIEDCHEEFPDIPWDLPSVHTVIIEEGSTIIDANAFHGHLHL